MRLLQKEGLVTLKELFIDGTKMEANANRYTFVWRGSINYHLAGLLDKIDSLYTRYNKLLSDNEYEKKYNIPQMQMFIISGMDRIREVIEKNRAKKIAKHKKIPNNTILEIDNCSPLELLKLRTRLKTIAEKENIIFIIGKGKKKSEIQQLYKVDNSQIK